MKNKSVLKAFGIMLLLTIVLTWIIPSASVGESGLEIGSIQQTGFADIFSSLEVVTTYFIAPSLFILFVGMFYGVANASGSLKAVVNKLVSRFKNEKNLYLIITILFYSLLTALTGMYIQLFMFIPLSIAVLLGLKYNRSQSILATVGASTVGLIAQIFNPFMQNMTGAETDKFIWVRVALLAVLIIVTIIYTIFISKKDSKEEKIENESIMFVPKSRSAKKKVTVKGICLFIVLFLLFVVFVLGLTNAEWITDTFTKVYNSIKGVKIGNFAIFAGILGRFETFGSWSYYSLIPTVVLATIVLSIFTKLSFSEMIEESYEGAKKVLPLAFLTALLSIILIFTLNSGFAGTIINFIAKSGKKVLVTIAALITTPFMVDLSYAIQYILSMLYYSTNNESALEIYGLIIQSIYGVVMLIAPSSILLMLGLCYTEQSYSKWVKYIWKFVLVVLALVLISIAVAKFL